MIRDVMREFARFARSVDAGQATFAIRPSEMRVLGVLCDANAAPCTPLVMAQRLGVSRPMITALVSRLIDNGLVAKMPSPDDGRSFFIVATKKGAMLYNNLVHSTEEMVGQIEKEIGKEKFVDFLNMMMRVNVVMERNMK